MILENISKHVIELSKQAEIDLKEIYDKIDEVAFYNSNRILSDLLKIELNMQILQIEMVMEYLTLVVKSLKKYLQVF